MDLSRKKISFYCKRNSVAGCGRGFVSRSRGYPTAIYCRQYCARTGTGTVLSGKVKFEAERGEEAIECKIGAREVI